MGGAEGRGGGHENGVAVNQEWLFKKVTKRWFVSTPRDICDRTPVEPGKKVITKTERNLRTTTTATRHLPGVESWSLTWCALFRMI